MQRSVQSARARLPILIVAVLILLSLIVVAVVAVRTRPSNKPTSETTTPASAVYRRLVAAGKKSNRGVVRAGRFSRPMGQHVRRRVRRRLPRPLEVAP